MYILNIARAIRKMSVNEIRDLFLKTIIKESEFLRKTVLFNETLEKNLLLLANKLIEKLPDPCIAKEHYQSFIRK